MITIRNANILGQVQTVYTISSDDMLSIDATGLTLLPALIDPHVHFRVPGLEHKEDWQTGARAAIAGGFTTVLEMPNTNPPTITADRLREKKRLIDAQLNEVGIPLRYHLYFGADQHHLGELDRIGPDAIGIKVFLGASTGGLVMENDDAFRRVCEWAAKHDMVVAVHAEDETILRQNTMAWQKDSTHVSVHSQIRSREAAAVALEKALDVSTKYGNTLYVLHASTKEEVQLVREAKRAGLSVYMEVTPHHLFLDESSYETLGTRVQMNPPLRTAADLNALWHGIEDGTIDTIGSDHAPHTLTEKDRPYGQAPSGIPGLETTLPLLLTAYADHKISLENIVALTRTHIEKIFGLPPNDDVVLVDLSTRKTVDGKTLHTKCGWSPFEGRELTGWPVYTIMKGNVYAANNLS